MSEEKTAPALGYSREGDVVTVRMTVEDWELLLRLIGIGGGAHEATLLPSIELVNRLNEGRPRSEWIPYDVTGEHWKPRASGGTEYP